MINKNQFSMKTSSRTNILTIQNIAMKTVRLINLIVVNDLNNLHYKNLIEMTNEIEQTFLRKTVKSIIRVSSRIQ